MMENDLNVDELLRPPSFVREQYSAFLFCPYSRKLRRRVYLYTNNGFALWVSLESDPSVTMFNERVPKVPVVIGKDATNAAPRAISVCKERKVTIHSFVNDLREADVSSEPPSPWGKWALRRGFRHIEWDSNSLVGNRTRFENLQRLLRYVSQPAVIPDPSLQKRLLIELDSVRRLTLSKLIDLFPLSDRTEVETEIARLILDGTIYSDIDNEPLSLITEVSAHHAVETR